MTYLTENRSWLLVTGLLFIILGAFAIAIPGLFTLSVEILIGTIFVIAGIVQAVQSFKADGVCGFFLSLLSAAIYIIIGGLLLFYPLKGALTLTILLAIFFFVQGIVQVVLAFNWKEHAKWGWLLFSGVISILLALIIWSGLPGSAVWVIGLLVGINLLFNGFSLVFLSTASGPKSSGN